MKHFCITPAPNRKRTANELHRIRSEEPLSEDFSLSFTYEMERFAQWHLIGDAGFFSNLRDGALVELNINNARQPCLAPAHMKSWASALEECIHLKVFKWYWSGVGCNDDWSVILPLLERPDNQLEWLEIIHSGKHVTIVHDSEVFDRLFTAVGNSNTIKDFRFDRPSYKLSSCVDKLDMKDPNVIKDQQEAVEMDEKQTIWIDNMVARNSSLEKLAIRVSPVTSFVRIFHALQHNQSITTLHIKRFTYGTNRRLPSTGEESKALHELMEKNYYLRELQEIGRPTLQILPKTEFLFQLNRSGRAQMKNLMGPRGMEILIEKLGNNSDNISYLFYWLRFHATFFGQAS